MPLRPLLVVVAVLATAAGSLRATAQQDAQAPPKAYARTPKAIAFQNDSQWEDNRWNRTELGPCLAATITAGGQTTLKGLAIRIGERGEAAVLFDTARLRYSAAWTGEFLKFGPRRFGLIRPPAAAGEVFFSTGKLAGWANGGRFRPRPDEITDPKVDASYGRPGSSVTCLPADWAAYRGHHTHGDRIVLSYTVGQTPILESPWYVRAGQRGALLRSLVIGPSEEPLQMLVADSQCRAAVRGGDAVTLRRDSGRTILVVPPRQAPQRLKVLVTAAEVTGDELAALRRQAGPPEDLRAWIGDDPGRFPETLTTRGKTSNAEGPYVIDTLTLPFENPYGALLFTAGHDFFSDGSAAVCTVHGDVWTVDGIDESLQQLRWRRFATGLHQPLGLKIVRDRVHVIGRNQITRLHDRNRDGEADEYENFNNQMIIAPRAHDYVTCLQTDPQGNFYFIHAKTGVMKVSADGSELTAVADGFRNPNGIGVSPEGVITAAPQQGTWTPESSLIVVEPGGYYGFGGPRVSTDRPGGWDRPMCFIPRAMDNSGGGQVWVQSKRWGPLENRLLHLSYGRCRLLLALTERIGEHVQGGTLAFPTTPADFQSGIMRGRFRPHDGQLYVSGLRGWQTTAIRDGCFQRVRYTGGPVHLPVAVKTYRNGLEFTFSEPLDRDFAQRPEHYFARQWNYRYSAQYGSPDFSVQHPKQQGRDEVEVISATLSDDGRRLFLEMPGRQPVDQLLVHWLLRSEDGQRFRGEFAHTINVAPRHAFPEANITRVPRRRMVSVEMQRRLQPGLHSEYRLPADEPSGSNDSDHRVERMASLRQPIDQPVTSLMPAGPFSRYSRGTVKAELSGEYDFRLQTNGAATLTINGSEVLHARGAAETERPVLLLKGHNRLAIEFESPRKLDAPGQDTAELKLLWKGEDFGWEPVPPSVLFHDSGAPELRRAERLRRGRARFAELRCHACHDVGTDSETMTETMLELQLPAPDLTAAGQRFNRAWLQQWLLDPQELHPGTTMPAVLGRGRSARRDAADLAAFLIGDAAATQAIPPTNSPVADTTRRGELLFQQQACLSCHHFDKPDAEDPYNRLSLHFADAKYARNKGGDTRRDALAAMIQTPTQHHRSTRMPQFGFDDAQSAALAAYVRASSGGSLPAIEFEGDPQRGARLFRSKGCQNCHPRGQAADTPARVTDSAKHPFPSGKQLAGCLVPPSDRDGESDRPRYSLSAADREALGQFIRQSRASLHRSSPPETAARLYRRLQCANCHDRDGIRSHRRLVIAEDGSGELPPRLPDLTWAGEKLKPSWTRDLLAGDLPDKKRPWLTARMPAFPAYAEALSHGLAAQHGVDAEPDDGPPVDDKLAAIGRELTLQSGLDCRQCHAIGDRQPRGDQKTAIALGVNFTQIRDSMRDDAYRRFMLDPARFDPKTRMIQLSSDRLTTKLKGYFDADARKQFDALWHYIQSLP